jgi:threonine/homoserine/homoserine lactone efflux protein
VEYYLSVILFCLVTSVTPGPNNIMLMSSGLNHGVLKTVPHISGIIVGFPLMVAALGFGLGTIFQNYPVIHQVIKIVGISYLLFLAWKIANTTRANAGNHLREPLTFMQAAVFQWLNPKAWVIAIGAIAAFTTVGNFEVQVIIIVFTYLFVGSFSMGLWLLMGASLQKILRSQKQLQIFNITMAILLVLSIVPIVVMEFDGGV